MRKPFFLTYLIFLTVIYYSKAQVDIKIVDQKSREVLPAANIEILNQDQVFITDQNGMAQIDQTPPFSMRISFVGYETQRVQIKEKGQKTIYLSPDERLLNEIVVEGYENNRKLIETPGSIFLLQPKDIRRFDETSLVRGLNTVPGVRMEQRSPGSYRISVRGSSLRAPFDVRNVKIYWNGVPFTDPNGITPLNLLDISQMGRIEVIKGPAASIYGAGGGVVNIKTPRADFDSENVKLGASWGSYGLQRYTMGYERGDLNSNVNLNFTHQSSDGFREHTQFNRNTAQAFATFYPSEKRAVTANIFYSDLFYEVPGGLTAEQFAENPRQARPSGFFPGSVEQNASVNYQAFMTSLSHEYSWSEHFENTTSIYGISSFFEMPFILDFERETRQGFGGRTTFDYNTQIADLPTKFVFGGEYQRELLLGRNFGNVGGQADTIRFDDEVRSWQSLIFAKAEIDLPFESFLTIGLSYNDLEYDIYRLTDAAMDTSFRAPKKFQSVWAPRIGLLKQILPNLAIQGSISKGFSPPSVKEVRTGEGSINTNLEAEIGTNYEVGIRGTVLNDRLNFDITGFDFALNETIVSFTDSAGVTRFRNTGATSQKGIELSTMYYLINQPSQFLSTVRLQSSYTYHHFRFENYIKEGEDYSGNQLTGVAPHILVSSVDIATKAGIYGAISHNFTDKIPLNDANTVYSDAYHLIDLKLGWEQQFGGVDIDLSAGINNLMNNIYSLGNDLNPFGGRYFQPSPDRNYYFGIKAEF